MTTDPLPALPRKLLDVACRMRVGETLFRDDELVDAAAHELKAERARADALQAELDVVTHKVITCGVASRHPDPMLTTRGAYKEKWDSPQAEDVRTLRARADALEVALRELHASTDPEYVETYGLARSVFARGAARSLIEPTKGST